MFQVWSNGDVTINSGGAGETAATKIILNIVLRVFKLEVKAVLTTSAVMSACLMNLFDYVLVWFGLVQFDFLILFLNVCLTGLLM